MRTLVILAIVLVLIAGVGAAAWQPVSNYMQARAMPKWRTAEVVEGDIVSVVNATGTIKPVLQISVGSFVSGPIDAEYHLKDKDGKPLFDKTGKPLNIAEFNQEIREGDEMAKIDPRIYKAGVDRDAANQAQSRERISIRAKALSAAGDQRPEAGQGSAPRPKQGLNRTRSSRKRRWTGSSSAMSRSTRPGRSCRAPPSSRPTLSSTTRSSTSTTPDSLAGRRHRHQSQDRSGADARRPVSDAGAVHRRARHARENARPCLGR